MTRSVNDLQDSQRGEKGPHRSVPLRPGRSVRLFWEKEGSAQLPQLSGHVPIRRLNGTGQPRGHEVSGGSRRRPAARIASSVEGGGVCLSVCAGELKDRGVRGAVCATGRDGTAAALGKRVGAGQREREGEEEREERRTTAASIAAGERQESPAEGRKAIQVTRVRFRCLPVRPERHTEPPSLLLPFAFTDRRKGRRKRAENTRGEQLRSSSARAL
ncbi:hypothetical protein MHYP_G00175640 [Metynnis hypsauchen]